MQTIRQEAPPQRRAHEAFPGRRCQSPWRTSSCGGGGPGKAEHPSPNHGPLGLTCAWACTQGPPRSGRFQDSPVDVGVARFPLSPVLFLSPKPRSPQRPRSVSPIALGLATPSETTSEPHAEMGRWAALLLPSAPAPPA